ncbi:MAG: DUF930 domain-containing protein [Shinella sp.]|nr:DUF930 domain-containing protein [Shinella sp.]
MSAGLIASVALHIAVAALLMFRLPEFTPEAQAEAVEVELVPPPVEEEEQEKPAQSSPAEAAPEQPHPAARAARLPQAFESSSPEREEKPSQDAAKPEPKTSASNEARSSEDQDGNGSQQPVLSNDGDSQSAAARDDLSDATPAPDETAEEKPAAQPETEEQPSEIPPDMTEASKLYSEDALSNPHIKAALGKLPPERRLVQICSIEALEQIRRSIPGSFPDMLVPFSAQGGLISGRVLTASGGAYRSLGRWYGIDFRCELDEEAAKLLSFRYEVGPAIPESEWLRRKLPTGS